MREIETMRTNGRIRMAVIVALIAGLSLMFLTTACGSGKIAVEADATAAVQTDGTMGSALQDDTDAVETTAVQQEESATAASSEEVSMADSGEAKKIKVKAIYLSGTSAGSSKILDRYIDVINNTELNSVVIDVKDAGRFNYVSSVPAVL